MGAWQILEFVGTDGLDSRALAHTTPDVRTQGKKATGGLVRAIPPGNIRVHERRTGGLAG